MPSFKARKGIVAWVLANHYRRRSYRSTQHPRAKKVIISLGGFIE